jgi:hypothetical protein
MKLSIEHKRLQNLLVGALEGGSNYWYSAAEAVLPAGDTYKDIRPGGKYADPDDYYHPLQIVPFVPGGKLRFQHEDGPAEVNAEKLTAGLRLMREKYPKHYADVIGENDDATTADVLLQLAAFGEIIYG